MATLVERLRTAGGALDREGADEIERLWRESEELTQTLKHARKEVAFVVAELRTQDAEIKRLKATAVPSDEISRAFARGYHAASMAFTRILNALLFTPPIEDHPHGQAHPGAPAHAPAPAGISATAAPASSSDPGSA